MVGSDDDTPKRMRYDTGPTSVPDAYVSRLNYSQQVEESMQINQDAKAISAELGTTNETMITTTVV